MHWLPKAYRVGCYAPSKNLGASIDITPFEKLPGFQGCLGISFEVLAGDPTGLVRPLLSAYPCYSGYCPWAQSLASLMVKVPVQSSGSGHVLLDCSHLGCPYPRMTMKTEDLQPYAQIHPLWLFFNLSLQPGPILAWLCH